MGREQGWAAEASFYSPINGSHSDHDGLIEQILTAAKEMQIRQRKESKINRRNPHWQKKIKKKIQPQRREQRLTFKDQIKRIGKPEKSKTM